MTITRVIFPPSVQVATYHSKIDFTSWPIAQGRYRGFDYTGRDISWWKNSPVSNSFFAWHLQEDFMGGYDHGRQAGVVHVGNHHVVCGAKLWEWGTGTVGRAWDKILTDADGPYAELMVGAFSDNQPDYSWIKPHEVKTFKQYWYPIHDIGGFKKANLQAAVNLELRPEGTAFVGFQTTRRYASAAVLLTKGHDILLRKTVDIGPDKSFTDTVSVPADTHITDLRASLVTADGEELIAYQEITREPVKELPETVKAPPKPEDIPSLEQLYLTGLRVEQIHNPRVDPMTYYLEALKRDAGDSRCNAMVGISFNKRGMYAEAEQHLRKAIERLTQEYTRSRTGEAHFQLGIALLAQHRDDEAYDQFYRATWDQACHSPAYYELAAISCRRGDFPQALEQIERSVSTNALDTKAHDLRAAILRKLGRASEAEVVARYVIDIDPLDFWSHSELYQAQLAQQDRPAAAGTLERLAHLMRDDVQAYLELATDFLHVGMFRESIELLTHLAESGKQPACDFPLVHYYLGYLYQQLGDERAAKESFAHASTLPADYCFPFRLESVDVLQAALVANPNDARADYYLGNLLFDHQPDLAIEHWKKSQAADGSLAVVHRNLGWAYYRVKSDVAKAIEEYERALSCSQLEPRLFLELDALYEFGNVAPARRLAALQANHQIVIRREDSFLREIMVLVLTGDYSQAIDHLEHNFFHAQEGRDEIHDVFVDVHLLEGLRLLQRANPAAALEHFQRASEYPDNLSVGRPKNDPRAPQVAYYTGLALEALGNAEKARELYAAAADQEETTRWPETQFYQALGCAKLGRDKEAGEIFGRLISRGKGQLAEKESTDFFAKFGQQANRRTREANAHYLIGLGLLGQDNRADAQQEFQQAVQLNLSHAWARYQLDALK